MFTLSVAKVIFIASSSKPSAALKLKNCPTFEPNSVDGNEPLPPKKRRPSWKVADIGQPLVLLQASSYPLSKNQLPEDIELVSKKGI